MMRSTEKSACTANCRHYESLVMPFSLMTAHATCRYVKNSAFAPYLDRIVLVYLGDILNLF